MAQSDPSTGQPPAARRAAETWRRCPDAQLREAARGADPLLSKEEFLLAARAFCNLYRQIKLYHKDPTFWHLNEEKCYMHRGRDEGSGWHRLSFCKGVVAHSAHVAGLKRTGGVEAFKSFVKAYGVDPDDIFPIPDSASLAE